MRPATEIRSYRYLASTLLTSPISLESRVLAIEYLFDKKFLYIR